MLALYRKLYETEPGRVARESWFHLAALTLMDFFALKTLRLVREFCISL